MCGLRTPSQGCGVQNNKRRRRQSLQSAVNTSDTGVVKMKAMGRGDTVACSWSRRITSLSPVGVRMVRIAGGNMSDTRGHRDGGEGELLLFAPGRHITASNLSMSLSKLAVCGGQGRNKYYVGDSGGVGDTTHGLLASSEHK